MGIPAFFKWLSEKYPKVVADILERQPNVEYSAGSDSGDYETNSGLNDADLAATNPNGVEFDNLYIDMNGLIHPCSHPEDRAPPATETEMFENVVKYVDRLFAAVRPRKLLFMAMDGVAPRAKMNQQRSRRFRASQDIQERQETNAEIRQELYEKGYTLPDEENKDTWDSNCITPGTLFMSRLSNFIHRYILERMNSNVAWSSIRVMFSDSNDPGEGEHKIMSFIRHQRAQVGFDANQWHVIHGLDADLIMLSLATHEGRFSILREQVVFTGRPMAQTAADLMDSLVPSSAITLSKSNHTDKWIYAKKLQFLHVHIVREYLAFEFNDLRLWCSGHSKRFELERIIDDFVFICFFVGNDFLPHLPSLDIREGAIDFLLTVYKQLFITTLDGSHLTCPGGIINLNNVGVLLARVGEIEDEVFRRRESAKLNEKIRNERRDNNYNHHHHQQQQTSDGGGYRQHNDYPYLESSKIKAVSKPVVVDAVKSYSTDENRAAAEKLKAFFKDDDVAVDGVIAVGEKRKLDDDDNDDDVNAKKKKKIEDDDDDGIGGDSNTEDNTVIVLDKDGDEVAVVEDCPIQQQCVISASDLKEKTKQRQMDAGSKIVDEFYVASAGQDPVMYHEQGWKYRYYATKFKDDHDLAFDVGNARQQIYRAYIQGLQWIMLYYYADVPSWGWYYPYHYAPMASDLINITAYSPITFQLSKPFRPFEQLLSVLPKYSINALPREYQGLMTSSDSPILDFYPEKSPIDPNGKKLPWQWILLLPFIDEKRLKSAIELFGGDAVLSKQELSRNKFGCCRLYVCEEKLKFEFHIEVEAALLSSKTICDVIQEFDDDDGDEDSPAHEWACYDANISSTNNGRPIPSRQSVSIVGKKEFDACIDKFSGKQTKLECQHHSGLSGFLRRESIAVDGDDGDEEDFSLLLPPLSSNIVKVAIIKSPLIPPNFAHQSSLLPTIRFPEPELSAQDFYHRNPRLSRDVNITDLAMQKNSYWSIPESISGMKSWGSMEPSPQSNHDRNNRPREQDGRYFDNSSSHNDNHHRHGDHHGHNYDSRRDNRDDSNDKYRSHSSRSSHHDNQNQQRMAYCYGGSDQASSSSSSSSGGQPSRRADPPVSQSFSFKQSVSKMMGNNGSGR